MITRAAARRWRCGQQTVEAGDPDIVEPVHVVAHDLGRDCCFFCHRYVRSSRSCHQDYSLAPLDREAPFDDSGLFVEGRIRYDFRYGLKRGGVRARDEQAVAALDDGSGDTRNLGGRLPLSKHHFRKPLAGRAMMVDLGKPQVFDRPAAGPGRAVRRRPVRSGRPGRPRAANAGRRADRAIRAPFWRAICENVPADGPSVSSQVLV